MLSRNGLAAVFTVILCAILLSLSLTQIFASEKVVWKIFKEKNDLFTIKYPSNWSPLKANPDSTIPINMFFSYSGRDPSSFAELYLSGQESIYTNSTDLIDSYPVYLQNEQNFKLLQQTECGKYAISNFSACHTIVTLKNTELEGKPVIKDLIVGTIGEDGSEYVVEYYVSKDLFDVFLPVVEEMIRSINITDTGLPDSDSASNEFPELPPLSEAPTLGKL